MTTTGSIWDHFVDYLIPFIAMLVYLVVTMRKKKNAPAEYEKEEKAHVNPLSLPPAPKRSPATNDLPPIRRKAASFHTLLEERKIDSAINTRDFSNSISEGTSELVSSEMLKHIDLDPAYAHKVKSGVSRARKLLMSKTSLRNAFLLQQIMTRPYE